MIQAQHSQMNQELQELNYKLPYLLFSSGVIKYMKVVSFETWKMLNKNIAPQSWYYFVVKFPHLVYCEKLQLCLTT